MAACLSGQSQDEIKGWSMKRHKESGHALRWSSLRLACVAAFGLCVLRVNAGSDLAWVALELLFLLLVAICAARFLFLAPDRSLVDRQENSSEDRTKHIWFVGGLFILLPFLSNLVQVRLFGNRGDATELVWLMMLQNSAIWQAAIARTAKQEWRSFLMSCFLMIFSLGASEQSHLFWIVIAFGFLASWWMMSQYWKSIEKGFVAVESVPLIRIRLTFVVLMTCLALGLGVLAWVNHPAIVALDGFMPTSGGQSYGDDSARQGVGNGDMLVGATDQAFTFGPVDSKLFLESQTASMYDLSNDIYGEAKPIRQQRTRAIALDNPIMETEQEGTESKKSGKEFSALRQAPKRSRTIKPEGSESDAVLHYIGKIPVHLRLQSYDEFDGTTWKQVSEEPSHRLVEPRLTPIADKPWMEVGQYDRSMVYPVRERATIKVINLKSDRIATPPLVDRVYIDKIDRPDFFGWTADGQLMMTGRDHVPQLTVIHEMYLIPNLFSLRDSGNHKSQLSHSPGILSDEQSCCRMPENHALDMHSMAEQWIESEASIAYQDMTDWQRVEAIIAHLRKHFVVDLQSVPPEECDDVLKHMLQTKKGPDYLISTAAAMAIRSIGLPSRIATGFYARPERYDLRSGQTEIHAEDLHTWVEVKVHGTWIPVEPCAGYAIPREHRTWPQWAMECWWDIRAWGSNHPWGVALGLLATVYALISRVRLMDAFGSTLFLSTQWLSPQIRIRSCLVLMRCRSWLRRTGTPSGATVREWLEKTLSHYQTVSDTDRLLFIQSVQRLAYSPRGASDPWFHRHASSLRRTSMRIVCHGVKCVIPVMSVPSK